jgi:hypothetical protein
MLSQILANKYPSSPSGGVPGAVMPPSGMDMPNQNPYSQFNLGNVA